MRKSQLKIESDKSDFKHDIYRYSLVAGMHVWSVHMVACFLLLLNNKQKFVCKSYDFLVLCSIIIGLIHICFKRIYCFSLFVLI